MKMNGKWNWFKIAFGNSLVLAVLNLRGLLPETYSDLISC